MLGDRIKQIREEKGLDLKNIADAVGVSVAYISLIESNKRQNPSTKVLIKIAKILEVSVDEFFKEQNDKNKNNLGLNIKIRKEDKIGNILKLLRQEKNITQRELAKKLNLSPSTIAMYETGKRNPDYGTLQIFADYFKVSIDYLLGRTNIKKPYGQKNTNKSKENQENELFTEIEGLSEESQKELKKYIELLKIKDKMDKGKDETLSALDRNA